MKFTYELPKAEVVLNTILRVMKASKNSVDVNLYKAIKHASLDFNESSNYSHKRWDAYDLDVILRVPASSFTTNSDLLEKSKARLKELCSQLIPAECGYDVNVVSIVPRLEGIDKDAVDIISESLESDKIFTLSSDLIEKGKRMSNAYLIIYCLENLIRNFIDETLTEVLGDDYEVKINLTNTVKSKVSSRKNEELKNKWLPLRGNNLLYYLDFNELGDVITNNWEFFKHLIPSQPWIKSKMDELYNIRCLIAHNSYIDDTSFEVLNVDYKQIVKQIEK